MAQLITSIVVALIIMHVFLLGTAYLILLERKIASWAQDRIGPNRVGLGGLVRPVGNLAVGALLAPFWAVGLFRDVDPDRIWQSPGGQKAATFHCWGFGQPLADGIKFLMKEDYNPRAVDKTLFMLAPVLAVIPALIGWAVVPWGGDLVTPWGVVSLVVADINIGVVYILAIGSLAVYGLALGGWASNNKYTFLGGIRGTAQMLSYEIPMGICVLVVILLAGSASATDLVQSQVGYWFGVIPSWYILQQPLAAVLFFICLLAESNRAPFDLAEAEQELIGGFHTEYSSMKFALFFLGEYMHMLTAAAFFTILFLGGWHLPFVDYLLYGGAQAITGAGAGGGLMGFLTELGIPVFVVGLLGAIIKIKVFLAKMLLLVAIMMWIRWTVPRFRFDQLMRLAWRGMIPIAILILLVTGTMVFFHLANYMWLANLGMLAFILAIVPFVPEDTQVNRRVQLSGSRFSGLTPEPTPPSTQTP
ncbi:MAG: complex I subunit 1 family protein [Phycisphaeraceae bacterium]